MVKRRSKSWDQVRDKEKEAVHFTPLPNTDDFTLLHKMSK